MDVIEALEGGKRTYTFKSGGTCRRCTASRRLRRRLKEVLKNLRGRALGDDMPGMMAMEACKLAEGARAFFKETEDRLNKLLGKINDMEGDYDDPNFVKAWEEAAQQASDMISDLEESSEDVLEAEQACSEAKDAAKNDKNGLKDAEDALKGAEKAAENLKKDLGKVQKDEEKALESQIKVVEVALKIVADETKERTKHVIDEKKKEIDEKERAIQEMLDNAKGGDKEEYEKLKEKFDAESAALKAEETRFKDEVSDADKHAHELAKLLMEAEFASDISGTYLFSYMISRVKYNAWSHGLSSQNSLVPQYGWALTRMSLRS